MGTGSEGDVGSHALPFTLSLSSHLKSSSPPPLMLILAGPCFLISIRENRNNQEELHQVATTISNLLPASIFNTKPVGLVVCCSVMVFSYMGTGMDQEKYCIIQGWGFAR